MDDSFYLCLYLNCSYRLNFRPINPINCLAIWQRYLPTLFIFDIWTSDTEKVGKFPLAPFYKWNISPVYCMICHAIFTEWRDQYLWARPRPRLNPFRVSQTRRDRDSYLLSLANKTKTKTHLSSVSLARPRPRLSLKRSRKQDRDRDYTNVGFITETG